ncbi:MAG: extracellular solute-binding protein [Rhodothermaceae bacterium]|nr:extracellular solute-binding protein [Rhodothermaceae bacterium]
MYRQLCKVLLFCLVVTGCFLGCEEPDERVHVRIWHQKIGAERVFFERAVDIYNDSHPDRHVEILYKETEELRNLFIVASAGGQGPELIYSPADNLSIFALTKTIRPISDALSPDYLSIFGSDGVLSWEGDQLMVADQVGNHLTLVYNKALIPEPPTRFDELITLLQELTVDEDGDGRIDRYGLTWNYTEPFFFMPFLTGFGGWMMDEDGNPTLNTPETIQAIQFILDLRDKYKVIPRESDYNIAETLFKEQRAAAIINGPWAWGGYADAGIDYGLARIPRIAETGNWSRPLVASKGYSLNANVEEEKLPYIRDVLEYLTNAEIQAQMAKEISSIPTIPSVREDSVIQGNPILRSSLNQVEVGLPMPIEPQMRQIWDGMRGAYQLIMNGSTTAAEGAEKMQKDAEKRIADTFL